MTAVLPRTVQLHGHPTFPHLAEPERFAGLLREFIADAGWPGPPRPEKDSAQPKKAVARSSAARAACAARARQGPGRWGCSAARKLIRNSAV